jgi:hypothetical protein
LFFSTTAALIMTMSVLGAVTPAAFAQNTSVNEDDDFVSQAIDIRQSQSAANFASAGNVGGDGDNPIVAGNNAVAASFQNQEATAANFNSDDDDFNTDQ